MLGQTGQSLQIRATSVYIQDNTIKRGQPLYHEAILFWAMLLLGPSPLTFLQNENLYVIVVKFGFPSIIANDRLFVAGEGDYIHLSSSSILLFAVNFYINIIL